MLKAFYCVELSHCTEMIKKFKIQTTGWTNLPRRNQ